MALLGERWELEGSQVPPSHIPCLEGVILTVFREEGGRIRFLVCSVMREGQEGEKSTSQDMSATV